MPSHPDIVVRDALIADGSGGPLTEGDVAIGDGLILSAGAEVGSPCAIDAMPVTSGRVAMIVLAIGRRGNTRPEVGQTTRPA